MGRRADRTKPQKVENPRTFRISTEIWDELQLIGEGNASVGLRKVYEHYTGGEMKDVNEKKVVDIVHKELTLLLDKGLHKYFIKAVNFWIRNDCKPATIEKYYDVFGVNGRDSIVAGRIMKRLEGRGVMLYEGGGFRPDIRCNNGISEELFLKYFKKYSEIVMEEPEIRDLSKNIAQEINDTDISI